jgi:hypothetical protein
MADEKKGKLRSLGENMFEATGELFAEQLGEPMGKSFIGASPGAAMLAGILRQNQAIIVFAPYIASVLFKNSIPQETVQGFVRGLMKAVEDMALPADPKDHKQAVKGALEPVFAKYKDALKEKGPPTKTPFTAALQGMEETKRRVLKEQIARSGRSAEILRLGKASETSSMELELFAEMFALPNRPGEPPIKPIELLIEHLTPPAKPETITSKMLHLTNRAVHWFLGKVSEYAKPDGEKLKSLKRYVDQRTAADEVRLAILRNPDMSLEEVEALMNQHFGPIRPSAATPPERTAV